MRKLSEIMKKVTKSAMDTSDATSTLVEFYIEQPHDLLQTGLAAHPADKLSGVPRYIRDISCLIAEIVDGFLALRSANKITASRVLIRPCIEAAMKLAAANEDPNNLLNIAYTEGMGDIYLLEGYRDLTKEWFSEGRPGIGPETVANAETLINERKELQAVIREKLSKQIPNAQAADKYLKPCKLAKAGKQEELYGGFYVLYCNFVHASLRAVNTWPDIQNSNDILAVAHCLRLALNGMEAIGGPKIPSEISVKLGSLVSDTR